MTLTRTGKRALAGVCALSLLLAACGDDEDGGESSSDTEETTTTAEETTESTEAETSEPEDETDTSQGTGSEDEPAEGEGDPEAVATAEAINLKLSDFAEGWTEEEPASDSGGTDDFDECFTTNDIAALTVGEAEAPTFSAETPDGAGGQIVTMQTVVFDSPESATAVLDELATPEYAQCTADGITRDTEGAEANLTPLVDDPPVGEQSVGLAGDVTIPGEGGTPQPGKADLHAIRTGEIVSFTITLDLGATPESGFEQTLGELYTLIAERQATEAG